MLLLASGGWRQTNQQPALWSHVLMRVNFLCVWSAADLLVNTLCLPFTLVYTLQGEWKFGGTLCFLLPYAQGLAVHVSTVTLNVIALDRHR